MFPFLNASKLLPVLARVGLLSTVTLFVSTFQPSTTLGLRASPTVAVSKLLLTALFAELFVPNGGTANLIGTGEKLVLSVNVAYVNDLVISVTVKFQALCRGLPPSFMMIYTLVDRPGP